jgi:hypothetical protein
MQYPSRLWAQKRLTTPLPPRLSADNTVLPSNINSGEDGSVEVQPPTLMQRLRAMSSSASKTLLRRTKSSPAAPLFHRKVGSKDVVDAPTLAQVLGEVPERLPSSGTERSGSISSDKSASPNVFRRPSELAGGISLSEIAVEEHVPDIIT